MKTFHPLQHGKLIVLVLLSFTLAGSLWAQPQYYNYQNVGTSSNLFPFNVVGGKAVQSLFLPGEFINPTPAPVGNITKVYFYTTTTASTTLTNLEIKMVQSNITDLPASWVTGLTTVYSHASATISSTANSWMSIDLDTPFPYDPGMSLIVEIGQCGSTGTGPNLRYNILSGFKRNYSVGGCPFVYSSQTGHTLNFGVDIGPAGSCSYSWTSQTSGTGSALNTIKAVNDMIGWAGGAGGVVRKTTDGGTTWTDGNPNPGVITGDIYAIESLGADTAWCTTSPSATNLYRTINGGTNWTQVHTQAGGFWNIIKFKNSSTGFVEGDPVGGRWSLWRTTDGGATWDSSGMFLADAGEAGWNNSASLIGDNIWFGTNNTKVYHSSNFGSSWTSGPTTGSLNGYSLHFNSPTLGLAGGTAVVKTTDGGVTYSAPITVPGSGNILGLGGDGNDFWCGRGAAIYRSTDAGATWVSEFTPAGTVNAMDIVKTGSCATGWAAGTAGSISKLTGLISGTGNNTGNNIPDAFKLSQNYPNPFNPSTTITFEIPKSDIVELKVYDMLGREVANLVSGIRPAGVYRVDFNAEGLSSGVYVYRIKVGDFVDSKKMTLLK